MTTKETVERYLGAIHDGGWEAYIADDFVFVSNNFDTVLHGKEAYLKDAGSFFVLTTRAEIRQMVANDDKAAVAVRYTVRNAKGDTGVCDVAELLTVKDGTLTSSSIFFDTKPIDAFLAQE